MAFEVFRRRSRLAYATPTIGIHKRGTVSINGSAFTLLVEAAKIKDRTKVYVQFLYDREKGIVGLRSVPPETPNSYPIRKQERADAYLLTGKAFFSYYQLDQALNRRFTARIYDGNVLGFSVAEDGD